MSKIIVNDKNMYPEPFLILKTLLKDFITAVSYYIDPKITDFVLICIINSTNLTIELFNQVIILIN